MWQIDVKWFFRLFIFCGEPASFLQTHFDLILLKPHHLTHDTVCHLDRTHEDEHIEHKLPDIAPHHRHRRCIGIDRRGCCRKEGEDDAGKHDNRSLQTYGGVAFDEALSHALARWACKGGKRHWCDGGVEVELEKPAVHRHNHNEWQHRDEQPADERHRP